MIGVDTNILVYARRRDSEWFERAAEVVKELAEGPEPWAIPWPCIHEFLAIVTHQHIYQPPTPLAKAMAQVDAWMGSPTLRLIGESREHWRELSAILSTGKIQGAQVHGARVAAICA
jgi:predicted nucleic acid-binding protein